MRFGGGYVRFLSIPFIGLRRNTFRSLAKIITIEEDHASVVQEEARNKPDEQVTATEGRANVICIICMMT